jgi:uncharacterized membrane protein
MVCVLSLGLQYGDTVAREGRGLPHGQRQAMKVTLYTKEDCAECRHVWDMLAMVSAYEDFDLQEAKSPEGAPVPCVRFEAPGSPFYLAEGLTEARFMEWLEDARNLVRPSNENAVAGRVLARRAGSAPTAEHERAHPVRSFFWRHRVGAVVSSLSAFVGLAWAAPLTVSMGWGTGLYNAVHSAYRLVCDQVPERSAQLGGLPVCLCWRCTAIYGGSLLFGALYAVGRDLEIDWLGWLRRPVSLVVMLLFGLPLILDGASHALGFRTGIGEAYSTDFWRSWDTFSADWWLRVITALVATIGAVKFLCPRLDKLGVEYEKLYRARRKEGKPVSVNSVQAFRSPRRPSSL